jgi:chromosome segregation ATPase
MDVQSLARIIEFLDDERRKDKHTINTLEERLALQTDMIETLQRRLSGLESDQSVLRTQSLPVQRETDILEQVRVEMRTLLEQSESRRLAAEREAERLRNLDREGIMRSISQLSDQLEKIQKQAASLPDVKQENDRLSDQIIAIQQRIEDILKRFDEPERRISLVEEQRRQEVRRLSQLESDYQELKKQQDTMRAKLPLVEDLAIRIERRVQEIQNSEGQRRIEQQNFYDQQMLLLKQRDTEINNLIKRFSDQDSEFTKNMERLEQWSQTHREMRRIIDDFERIGDRLERRFAEVSELQRLSEERFRTEWNAFKDDESKKWKQMTLSSDEIWRNHDREFELYTRKLAEIEQALAPLEEQLKRLWSLQRDMIGVFKEMDRVLEKNEAAPLNPAPTHAVNGQNAD